MNYAGRLYCAMVVPIIICLGSGEAKAQRNDSGGLEAGIGLNLTKDIYNMRRDFSYGLSLEENAQLRGFYQDFRIDLPEFAPHKFLKVAAGTKLLGGQNVRAGAHVSEILYTAYENPPDNVPAPANSFRGEPVAKEALCVGGKLGYSRGPLNCIIEADVPVRDARRAMMFAEAMYDGEKADIGFSAMAPMSDIGEGRVKIYAKCNFLAIEDVRPYAELEISGLGGMCREFFKVGFSIDM